MEVIQFELWILFFITARFIGIILLIPFLNSNFVPVIVKACIVICFSYLILLNIEETIPMDVHVSIIIMHMLLNFLFGVLIGTVVNLVLYALQFAGNFIGIQMGFAMANVFDPQMQEQISLVSQMSFLFGTMLFIIMKGHIYMFSIIIDSFEKVPVLYSLNINSISLIVSKLADIFVIGLQFAMPVTAIMIFIKLSLGIVSRLIPQMNVFMVGLPLQVGIGFFVFMVVLLIWQEQFTELFFQLLDWTRNIVPIISR